MTSLKATKTIASTNKYVISALEYTPPFQRCRNSRRRFLTKWLYQIYCLCSSADCILHSICKFAILF